MKERSQFRKRLDITTRKLFNYFLQGLLFAAPIGFTGFIVYKVFEFSDSILRSRIEDILNIIINNGSPQGTIHIPGLGLVIMLILITFVGYAGKSVIAQPFKVMLERLLKRVPLLQMVYSSIRDFMEAFVGKEKKFNQPVLVKVNKISDLEKLGFVTETDLSFLGISDKVAVYFPHSYNFSGELFIVPADQVKPLDVNSGELMKFIVSGGVTKM
jgi:uncharacterized membrane protein